MSKEPRLAECQIAEVNYVCNLLFRSISTELSQADKNIVLDFMMQNYAQGFTDGMGTMRDKMK